MFAQSAGAMSAMSWYENNLGRLRRGQRELAQAILGDPKKTKTVVEWPTGYGKSLGAGIVFHLLREMGFIDRALIVVPTLTQLNQYIDNFAADAYAYDIPIMGVMQLTPIGVKYHQQNRADVLVTTVQSLMKDKTIIYSALEKNKWLLVADEHHHYAEDNKWGDALQALSFDRVLGISATPVRTSREYSILGSPDLTISLQDAYTEGAIRPVRAHIERYALELVVASTDERIQLTTDELREMNTDKFSKYEASRDLRYENRYLHKIIQDALTTWRLKNLRDPGEHGMLVYAMSCKHAKFVCEMIQVNALTLGYDALRIDWIGTGINGRDSKTNKQILDQFKKKELDCVVQVDLAGEGFNAKHVSVLLFLNILGISVKAFQQVGRGLRTNPNVSKDRDICDVFCSPDTVFAELVENLSAISEHLLPEDERSSRTIGMRPHTGQLFEFPPPSVFIDNSEHYETDVKYPFGFKEFKDCMEYLKTKYPEEADNIDHDMMMSKEKLERMILDIYDSQEKVRRTPPEDRVLEIWRGYVGGVSATYIGALIRHLGLDPKDNKIYIAVNGKAKKIWKKERKMLDPKQLKEQYEWYSGLLRQLEIKGDVPEWIQV